jgi:polar amino acid transport system substrate-binding protein
MNHATTMSARIAVALAWAGAAVLSAAADVSARTLAEVQSLRAISMCAHPDALPYASNRPEAPGIQVEMGRAIAEGLGVALSTEWVVPRRRVAAVNCDMLFDSINDPKVYDWPLLLTRPYQKSGLALGLGRDGQMIGHFSELKKGQKIGVMVNSVASVVLGKAGVTTSPYAFQADMLEDLEKGQLYGAAVSSASLSYHIFRNPDSGLKLANAFDGVPDLTWDVAVGLRKSDQALLDAVNRVLDSLLADGTVTRIYARYGVEHRLP